MSKQNFTNELIPIEQNGLYSISSYFAEKHMEKQNQEEIWILLFAYPNLLHTRDLLSQKIWFSENVHHRLLLQALTNITGFLVAIINHLNPTKSD